jgi:hypothetical protein
MEVRGDHTTILLIYDLEGNLEAASDSASDFALRPDPAAPAKPELLERTHYTVTFGQSSDLTAWLTIQFDKARKQESDGAQSTVDDPGWGRMNVKFETLRFLNEDSRYAVLISEPHDSMPEGASVITRQEWHDIKNHLGGLKLYATFLKKKIPDREDQDIVEKLLKGINGLIDHLAQIRSGDAK